MAMDLQLAVDQHPMKPASRRAGPAAARRPSGPRDSSHFGHQMNLRGVSDGPEGDPLLKQWARAQEARLRGLSIRGGGFLECEPRVSTLGRPRIAATESRIRAQRRFGGQA